MDALRLYGWRTYHTWNSSNSTKGFPDIVAIHPSGRGIAWEIKGPKGRVTREQQEWINLFKATGFDARVIFPRDYDNALLTLL